MSTNDRMKECRLCGSAEPGNIDIFSNSFSSRGLATKINTVFPIVLYERDPLPKSICQRCLDNLNHMYHEIELVLKVNTKRVRQMRDAQPDSEYSKVLDIIKHSKRSIRKTIRSSLGAHICEHAINRKLIGINAETSSKKRKKMKRKSAGSPPSHEVDPVRGEPPVQEAKICELKSQLELNGCSLLQMPPKKAKRGRRTGDYSASSNQPDPSNLAAAPSNLRTSSKLPAVPSNLPGASSNLPVATSNLPAVPPNLPTGSSHISTGSSNLPVGSSNFPAVPSNLSASSNLPAAATSIKCGYCPLSFASLAVLAQHQVQHMQLHVTRLSEKRLLGEHLRRARLLNASNGRKCIRCLNCWRIFAGDEAILKHWTLRECEYFCRVCGKEYPLTPKMLREHVPAAHGIRYRAMRFPTAKRRKSSSAEEGNGSASEESAKRREAVAVAPPPAVTCHLCRHSFKSIQARNSHMRIHKTAEPDAKRTLATVAAKQSARPPDFRIDCVIGQKIKKEPLPSEG